jgi:SAM-dependent methyltransferase
MAIRTPTVVGAMAEAARRTRAGRLPDRYDDPYETTFERRVREAVAPGMHILDAGGGCQPTIPAADRPPGCRYVGLDLSREELEKAGPGGYDEMVEADLTLPIESFRDSFDLIVSFQVMEHVKPLDVAIENLRTYLRPGGRLIAQMSGKFSAFGLINQALPGKAGLWVLTHLVGKSPSEVFPAYYHRCWQSALERALEPWSGHEIVPLHVGAVPYWKFSKTLQAFYVGYEEWACRGGHDNLASYYVIDAVR